MVSFSSFIEEEESFGASSKASVAIRTILLEFIVTLRGEKIVHGQRVK